jgi:hypothetical protein
MVCETMSSYSAEIHKYRQWLFNSVGEIQEFAGTSDDKESILTWRRVSPEIYGRHEITQTFVDKDNWHILDSMVWNHVGDKFVIQGTATRKQ